MATHSAAPTHTQVDVAQAEQDFQELSRQLSRQLSKPQNANEKESYNSARSSDDVEKNEVKQGFDLREYLTTSNDLNDAAGIKHKVCERAYLRRLKPFLRLCSACWCNLGRSSMRGC